MTGQALLEQLKAMTPEQLGLQVITQHWDYNDDGEYEAFVTDTRVEVTNVLAREIPLLTIGQPRAALVPVIVIA